jgi:hypothetical protein
MIGELDIAGEGASAPERATPARSGGPACGPGGLRGAWQKLLKPRQTGIGWDAMGYLGGGGEHSRGRLCHKRSEHRRGRRCHMSIEPLKCTPKWDGMGYLGGGGGVKLPRSPKLPKIARIGMLWDEFGKSSGILVEARGGRGSEERVGF